MARPLSPSRRIPAPTPSFLSLLLRPRLLLLASWPIPPSAARFVLRPISRPSPP